jgi:hypothetical protein
MPAASYEGHGGLEQIAGETFGQQVGYDPSVYNLYGYDPAVAQQQQWQQQFSQAQGAASSAQAAVAQFEAEHRDELNRYEGMSEKDKNDPFARTFHSGMGKEDWDKYDRLKQAAAQTQQAAQSAQQTFQEQMAGAGPTKFDTEQQRLLEASTAKQPTFEEMAGPYLSALEKSKAEMQGATGLYKTAAEGKGPSAAQDQYQSALDQAARAQMGAAGAMRGGALNQVSAQRDAALAAGQQEAQASSQSAALRAQEMQAAMQGYAQSAGQLGQLDLNTANMATQAGLARQQNMAKMQQFYESLRHQGYSEQAAMKQAQSQFDVTQALNQRQYDINLSNLQHGRQNEAGQAVMGMVQGGMSAAAQVGGAMLTGGASIPAQVAGKVAQGVTQGAMGSGGGGYGVGDTYHPTGNF